MHLSMVSVSECGLGALSVSEFGLGASECGLNVWKCVNVS